MNNDDIMAEKLEKLKAAYIPNLQIQIEQISNAYDSITLNNDYTILIEGINNIHAKVHKISGTSGMYGFKAVSKVATEFEFRLKDILTLEKIEEDHLILIKEQIEYLKTEMKNSTR